MLIPIDRQSRKALHRQIHDHLADLIQRGVFSDGERLPPTRQLALAIGVTRATVSQAYEQLQNRGLVRTTVGAGTFVSHMTRGTGNAIPDQFPASGRTVAFDWDGFIGDRALPPEDAALGEMLESSAPDRSVINLLRPIPDLRLAPLTEVRRTVKEVLRHLDATALDYGSPWGYEPLREALTRQLATEGMDRTDDTTVIVNGSQQGIDLVVRTLVSPGEVVITERPAYKGAIRIFQAARAQVRCLPLDRDGLDVGLLARALKQEAVRLIYLTPTFQNPTGVTTTTDRLRAILELARTHQVPVLEDGCFRGLRYDGSTHPALKTLDEDGLVVHLGTFSKTLFPGLRVGWIAAPRVLAERLSLARHDLDLGSVTLAQMVIHSLFERGDITRHLDRVRGIYRDRRDALLAGLDRHLPQGTSCTRPDGGMSLWVRLPAGLGSLGVVRRAAARGVLVAPGTLFDPAGHDLDGFRLAFSTADPSDLQRAAEILGGAIREEMETRKGQEHPPPRLPWV